MHITLQPHIFLPYSFAHLNFQNKANYFY